ncbi:Hypothetical predicted protein [Cloeon dipterum]|uniref:RNA 3'-terminal phosphate cyclase n=1 Tax=Cloeon dipterum TaxID=197152 RepID=A0A8S1CZ31_9INSE|nr:Hypothetical predicted protein [Cloeon dipterum]
MALNNAGTDLGETKGHENRDMVVIDGSLLEGGGQVLRIAVALSAIRGKAVKITNIRAGRKKPGLAEQHLKGLLLVRDMCNGELENAHLGSTEIIFRPGKITSGTFSSKISTAGSVSLLMQIAVPCALFAPGPCNFNLRGGTDADMAPPIDYLKIVTSEVFAHFGAKFETQVLQRGFFPKGGGEVNVKVDNIQTCLKPIILTQPGKIISIEGSVNVGGSCPIRVGHEFKQGAESLLLEEFGCKPNISVERFNAYCPGSSFLIVGKTSTGCIFGSSVISHRSKSPAQQGEEAVAELIKFLPGQSCLDSFAQDQIILPMSLAAGTSTVVCGPLTLHTQTAIEIVKQLSSAKFEVEKISEMIFRITCTGDPPVLAMDTQ